MRKDNNLIKYFIYCRKSSESEDRQVQSVTDQIKEMNKIKDELGLKVVDTISDLMSAKNPRVRPGFNSMIDRIKKGEADGILVWKINRLARNPVDGGEISWLLQKGLIKNIKTYGKDYYSEDNVLMMQVELGMANQYVKDLSVDTKRGVRAREERGFPNGVASIGYLNDMTNEPGNREWKVDDMRFPIIKKLLDIFSLGNYSIRQLTTIANEEIGLRTPIRKRQGGKKISISYMDKILRNPVYAGFFFDIDGNKHILHESIPRMINENIYYHIQKILRSNTRCRASVNKEVFAYTGKLKCGECGGTVTAEIKHQLICPKCKYKFAYKNKDTCPKCNIKIEKMNNPKYLIYTYYHCCSKNKKLVCRKNITEESIDNYLVSYFKNNLSISDRLRDWCIKNVKYVDESDKQSEYEKNNNLKILLKKKEKEIEELTMMKIRGLLDDDDYLKTKNILKLELESLKQKIGNLSNNSFNISDVYKAFDLSIGIEAVFKNGSSDEKKKTLSEIGSNLILKDKKLSIINTKLYSTIINGLLDAKTKNPRFEPENIIDTSSRNEVFEDVRPTLLRRQGSNL